MRRACKYILLSLLCLLLVSGCAVVRTASPAPEPSPEPTATPEPTPVVIRALGREFNGEEKSLDLRQVSPEKMDEILSLIAQLPKLERIETAPEEGENDWQLAELNRLREGLDRDIPIICRFTLFGQTVSSEDEEISYCREEIGDEQLPTLRQAMFLLSGCHRLVLDDCMLSYDKLAELREEFPERGLVWRVRYGVESSLTDATSIWTCSLTDENCDVLKYCTEVLYMDVGENKEQTNFKFLDYLTKLQVLIVSYTRFDYPQFVTHCPDLEFLEMDYCAVSDLTPLKSCKNLRHLSLVNDTQLKDITPLFELTGLERLRVMILTGVPAEQIKALEEHLPDTVMVNNRKPIWRYDMNGNAVPRYVLLREQIGYSIYKQSTDRVDWHYIHSKGYTRSSVFTCS